MICPECGGPLRIEPASVCDLERGVSILCVSITCYGIGLRLEAPTSDWPKPFARVHREHEIKRPA